MAEDANGDKTHEQIQAEYEQRKEQYDNSLTEQGRLHEARKAFDAAEIEAAKTFDKYMLTLASGSLGLSVTFFKEIIHTPAPYTGMLLYFAWMCFVASIVSMLWSILAAQHAARVRIADVDSDVARLWGGRGRRYKSPRPLLCRVFRLGKTHPWGDLVDALNKLAIWAFMAGAFFFILFSGFNLRG